MKETDFKRLIVIEDDNEGKNNINKLDKGDFFLYGLSIINQKGNKKVGNSITYYQVIEKNKNGVEYTPIYDYLEKE